MTRWTCAWLLAASLSAHAAQAQTYPTRPVTFLVTASAGGVTDVVARALGQRLSEMWGQQIVVENRGGSGHVTGAAAIARSPADGHALLVAEAGAFVTNPTLYAKGKLPYDAEKDFAPITGLVRINQGLLANRSLPVKNVTELLALARQKPREITYATAGIGSAPQMNIALMENMTGVKLTPVHYRGAALALNDLIGEHVNLMSVAMSLALPPFRDDKLKILGVGTAKRLPRAPDIPTLAESGLPGYEAYAWFGMFAPAGTPRAVVMKINADVRRVFDDPAFQDKFLAPQMFESMMSTPEEFATFILAEQTKWAKVIRDAGLHVD
jgi:tripartite-type tricarboxylate transporter receptor subunit TctC